MITKVNQSSIVWRAHAQLLQITFIIIESESIGDN